MKNLFVRNKKLYLITDRNVSGLSHQTMVRQAIRAGIKVIQVREKSLTKKDLFNELVLIRTLTLKYGVTLIINDYVDIALALNADGVHIGQDDMPVKEVRKILGKNRIIGVSAHSLREARNARDRGADYIGYGPIFKTFTKNAGESKGPESIIEIKKNIPIPVVAIGGITPENVSDVLKNGADAAAVASGILSGDIARNTKKFLSEINR